jgi:hypothetical protein
MSRLPQHCDRRPSSLQNNHPRVHNLDIRQYGLDELYALFGCKREVMTIDDLKRAKHRVLMTHPDKSGMPAEYFIFYKKVLEALATDYTEMHRVSESGKRMTEMAQNDYNYNNGDGEEEERARMVAGRAAKGEKFSQDFNRIFEEQLQTKVDDSRNEWFRDDRAIYDTSQTTKGNMAQSMEEIKRQQKSLAIYNGGVRDMTHFAGSKFYDQSEEENDSYISGDPFAKLKYEDLRKVHKDETVFRVSESDYNSVRTYRNVEEYNRSRSSQQFEQITKEQGERILLQREQERAARLQQYQRQEYERGLENARKQEAIKSMFLRLDN